MPEATTASPWLLPYPSATGKVSLGATDIQELAERLTTVLSQRLLTSVERSGSYAAVGGEMALQTQATGAITTLPSVSSASLPVGVFAGSGTTTKITTSGGAGIFGDFINNASTITLGPNQHVILFPTGTYWLIIAGTPKNEAGYTALTSRVAGVEYGGGGAGEVIARPATVYLSLASKGSSTIAVNVNGVQMAKAVIGTSEQAIPGIKLPAGVKWKLEVTGEALATFEASSVPE